MIYMLTHYSSLLIVPEPAQDFKKYTVPTNLWEQLFPQIPTNLSEQYTWCSNRKKHVKGGGLL